MCNFHIYELQFIKCVYCCIVPLTNGCPFIAMQLMICFFPKLECVLYKSTTYPPRFNLFRDLLVESFYCWNTCVSYWWANPCIVAQISTQVYEAQLNLCGYLVSEPSNTPISLTSIFDRPTKEHICVPGLFAEPLWHFNNCNHYSQIWLLDLNLMAMRVAWKNIIFQTPEI